ncbi:MAG: branched-chain amino acid ABC transporter permease [Ardenticatenaceae bacterium]|nr:branched-chain amino acid ABC transporter permease [Ardenticatenaceae bacterium]
MNWILVPQQLINGLLQGGILALIALGIVLIYKSSEVFNFAQGHMVMVGAYLTWMFSQWINTGISQVDLLISAVGALIIAVGLGWLIERLALRPMTGQPLLSIILITLGLAQLFEGLTTVFFGTEPKSDFPGLFAKDAVWRIEIPPVNGESIVFLNQLTIPYARLAAFILALVVAVLLILLFNYTSIGLSMRATSENHDLARSVGIKVSNVFGLSWAIAGVVATIGGILLATIFGVSINLSTVALVAFPAILLGGLESFAGAIIGGLSIGLIQALVQAAKLSEVRNSFEIAPYVFLLLILVLRPEGLFGQKRIERI